MLPKEWKNPFFDSNKVIYHTSCLNYRRRQHPFGQSQLLKVFAWSQKKLAKTLWNSIKHLTGEMKYNISLCNTKQRLWLQLYAFANSVMQMVILQTWKKGKYQLKSPERASLLSSHLQFFTFWGRMNSYYMGIMKAVCTFLVILHSCRREGSVLKEEVSQTLDV